MPLRHKMLKKCVRFVARDLWHVGPRRAGRPPDERPHPDPFAEGEFIAAWRQFGRPSAVRILNDVLYVDSRPGGPAPCRTLWFLTRADASC